MSIQRHILGQFYMKQNHTNLIVGVGIKSPCVFLYVTGLQTLDRIPCRQRLDE